MRAVILVERGFQDEEFIYPYYRMLEEGWEVDVATPDGKDVHGKYGVPARATHAIAALRVYHAAVIPGGFECPDRLRVVPAALRFLREMNTDGKLIAAICHGPWVLISAGLAKNRRMTGYKSIADDLKNAGALWRDDCVVVDSNIITADHYRHNGEFMKEVIGWRQEHDWPMLEVTHV